MSPESYKKALTTAKKDLADSIEALGEAQQRTQELDDRILQLRQTVSALSKLCGEKDFEVEDALGLTDSIRAALQNAPRSKSFTAQEVRLLLEARGFNTKRYGNLLASIHTVLKRLVDKGEVMLAGTIGEDQKQTYLWKHLPAITKLPPPPKTL
jgi:chromosome segregation ATPase